MRATRFGQGAEEVRMTLKLPASRFGTRIPGTQRAGPRCATRSEMVITRIWVAADDRDLHPGAQGLGPRASRVSQIPNPALGAAFAGPWLMRRWRAVRDVRWTAQPTFSVSLAQLELFAESSGQSQWGTSRIG
jgi:hypothetical protein